MHTIKLLSLLLPNKVSSISPKLKIHAPPTQPPPAAHPPLWTFLLRPVTMSGGNLLAESLTWRTALSIWPARPHVTSISKTNTKHSFPGSPHDNQDRKAALLEFTHALPCTPPREKWNKARSTYDILQFVLRSEKTKRKHLFWKYALQSTQGDSAILIYIRFLMDAGKKNPRTLH